jgi:hypothetical protein
LQLGLACFKPPLGDQRTSLTNQNCYANSSLPRLSVATSGYFLSLFLFSAGFPR